MSLGHHPQIVTDGLILLLDPANKKSYDGTTVSNVTTMLSLGASGSGLFKNAPFNYNTTTYNVGVLEINNAVGLTTATSTASIWTTSQDLNSIALAQNFTVMFAAKKNYYGVAGNDNGNSQLFAGAGNGYNNGWRISESTQGPQGTGFTGKHNWYLGLNDINTNISASDPLNVNRLCIVGFSISPFNLVGFCNGTVTTNKNNPLTYVGGTSIGRLSYTSAGNGSFNGVLGYFMIYNRALTVDELNQNFEALRGRYNL